MVQRHRGKHPRGQPNALERFPVPDSALDLFEPDSEMSLMSTGLLEERVRRKLLVPVIARTDLDSGYEVVADVMITDVGIDIPAFEESDGACVAPVCVRPLADLRETDQSVFAFALSNNDSRVFAG